MAKLKDIAEYVGVSISTVSRVMNNDDNRHISQETKAKIWKAARELGYERNEAFGSNSGKKRHKVGAKIVGQIGCIVSAPQNKYNHPYFSPILAGIEKKLGDKGYSLAYVLTLEEVRDKSIAKKLLQQSNLDGFIIVEGIPSDLQETIKRIVPAVVGIDISDTSVPVITYDRVRAAKMAVEHLLEQGHRKIGFIGGAGLAGDIEREKRYRGYKYALQEAGLEVNAQWVLNSGWDVNKSYQQMVELLSKEESGKWPTAIFAASDILAISAMRAISERGLRIPEDCAVIGLDNIEVSEYTSPPLSTIHIPKFEIGKMAAQVLVDRIQEPGGLPFKLFLPFEMMIRQSSDYLRQE